MTGATRSGRVTNGVRAHGPGLFYRQVVAELRKVVWPTQQQLVTYFFVVMVFVVFMMALVSGLDLAIGKAVFWLFNGQPKS